MLKTIRCALLLSLFLTSCGKEQATLYKLKGQWKAVSKVENGVESIDTGEIFMYYRFEACQADNPCWVRIGITENGESHDFDSESYKVSGNGKVIYFSNDPWDILLLNNQKFQIRNEEDSLEIRFEKM